MLDTIRLRLRVISLLLLLLIAVHMLNMHLDGYLGRFGIMPRSLGHWYHILTAPFIHANYVHLMNNLMGLTVFGSLCLLRSIRFFLYSSVVIILLSGTLVWLFGRSALHIGASGWIFGLWSLSIATAWFDRRLLNILLAILVVVFYGGMAYGVMPTDPRVSFESHLAGAIAGVVAAFAFAVNNKPVREDSSGSAG